MLRGYALTSKHSTASDQELALGAAGVTVVYVEGRGGEGFDALLTSLRKGDALAVVRLADLAANRRQLRERMKAVHAKGCYIVETSTKRDTRKRDLTDMIFDATETLTHAGKGHSSEKAREYGSRGGRPPKDRGISDKEAEAHWFDMRHNTNADAIEHMGCWTVTAAWRKWGASGRKTGPRRPLRAKLKRR